MSKTRWREVPLRDVLTPDDCEVEVLPTTSYDMSGIYSYARGLFSRGILQGSDTSYKVLHKVSAGQFILSQLKGWEGAIALAQEADEGRFLPPHNLCFRADEFLVDKQFLLWFLKQPRIWELLRANARGMGARRETVSADVFLRTKLSLPPLLEQKRIASQLHTASDLVERRKQAGDAVKNEISAALRAAFARITENAPLAMLGDVAPLVRRRQDIMPERKYTEIGVRSFYKGLFKRRTINGEEFTWQKLFKICEGDIVFSNLMAWEQAIGIATSDFDGCVGNHRMLTCEPDCERVVPEFLFYFFQTATGFAAIEAGSPGSIARNKTLSPEHLVRIEIPIPSLAKQQWFRSLQVAAATTCNKIDDVSKDLAELVPALLSSLFP